MDCSIEFSKNIHPDDQVGDFILGDAIARQRMLDVLRHQGTFDRNELVKEGQSISGMYWDCKLRDADAVLQCLIDAGRVMEHDGLCRLSLSELLHTKLPLAKSIAK